MIIDLKISKILIINNHKKSIQDTVIVISSYEYMIILSRLHTNVTKY